jgi:hypothetical protein
MVKTKDLRYLRAVAINVDISRENQTATLDLPIVDNDVLAVEISLPEFRRFHQHVAEQLRQDSSLFEPVPRV